MKYYQILETVDNNFNVGVIKVEKDNIPTELIQEAISAHLDEDIQILSVEVDDYDSSLTIHIKRFPSNDTPYKDVFLAHETWLYF